MTVKKSCKYDDYGELELFLVFHMMFMGLRRHVVAVLCFLYLFCNFICFSIFISRSFCVWLCKCRLWTLNISVQRWNQLDWKDRPDKGQSSRSAQNFYQSWFQTANIQSSCLWRVKQQLPSGENSPPDSCAAQSKVFAWNQASLGRKCLP